ncbi:MAG: hypothetical protein NT005_09760, partial [Spirochaetes bacterium]|nr:hypothetical protein [Spirochaetota bacterium]
VGEVSLTGEVRPVPGLEKRVRAARELGFDRMIGPRDDSSPRDEKSAEPGPSMPGFTAVLLIQEAVKAVFSHPTAQ